MSRTTRKTSLVLDEIMFPCDVSEWTPDEMTRWVATAESYLWGMTGRRFGVFQTFDDLYSAPCNSACIMPDGSGDVVGGNACCRIELFMQPVRSVSEVRIDGVPLDPAGWVLEGNHLMRLGECWPCDPTCAPAGISVDYEWGIDWSYIGELAVAELACEFAAGNAGEDCRLPERATQISRQGVTIDMESAADLKASGNTGMKTVDRFLDAVNPARLASRSRVLSPDLPVRRG